MIYDNFNKELIAFIENPIKNAEHLVKQTSQLSTFEKAQKRFPFLRRNISTKTALKIFKTMYFDYLMQARDTLGLLAPYPHEPLTPQYLEKILIEFTKFFKIEAPLNRIDDSSIDKDLVDLHIHLTLATKIEYHSNRICEAYELSDDYFYSIISNEKLWISFYLSEIYFLVHNGFLTLTLDKKGLTFTPAIGFENRIKGYWLSESFENGSKLTDESIYSRIKNLIKDNRRIPPELANATIDYTLDKIFSINVKYLSKKTSADPSYQLLREVVFFSLIVECSFQIGINSITRKSFLKSRMINKKSLSIIDSELAASPGNIGDQQGFIFKPGDSKYSRGPLAFKYGLRKFAGTILESKKTPFDGKDFKTNLGYYFESDYIANYLKNFNQFGYTSYRGFKSGTNSAIKGHDIDIVLYNQEHDTYYFIQVKYRFSAIPTYLSEQYKFFNEEKFKKGYTRQLLTLKENFYHESIRNQMKSIGIDGAKIENSHFILLHNIPFLNFYEYKGIFFYEWNLLRNILQDGKIYWHDGDDFYSTQSKRKLALHKPNDIVNAYLENSATGTVLKKKYELYTKSKCNFKMEKELIECQLL